MTDGETKHLRRYVDTMCGEPLDAVTIVHKRLESTCPDCIRAVYKREVERRDEMRVELERVNTRAMELFARWIELAQGG